MGETVSVDDVFISYAHIDNEPMRGVEFGWVSNLHYDVERALSRQLGGHCSIWFDRSELRGHHAVTPEISAKLNRAETLVAILSESYLQSEWCRKELELFQTRFGPNPAGRLFVVDISGLEREKFKALGLGDLTTYKFWYRDERKRVRTYGLPEPRPDEPEYYRWVDDLATDIADSLKALRKSPIQPTVSLRRTAAGGHSSKSADASQKSILLAEVTDDLEPLRQQLRRYLEQTGRRVVLCDTYGVKADTFEKELGKNLAGAALFAQLLSAVPSRSPAELPEGYAALQFRHAIEAGVRVIQWRDPSTAVDEVADPIQRKLLLEQTVQAVPFETFKRLVIEAADSPPERVPPATSFVFINAEKSDRQIANRIKDYVGRFASAFLPVIEGKPEELRRDIEENIVDCDGLLVVYGDGSAAWVHQQLRLYNKLAPRRQKPIKLLAVIEAPPEAKPGIDVAIPGMSVLNCRSGLDDAKLEAVLTGLAPDWRQ